jgi:PAS domain S-box-containing protein
MTTDDDNPLAADALLSAMNDGVYATDIDRRIVYWGPSAERITGWRGEEILGRHCSDDVLCHEDKDGRRLCGREHCPLHRAMVTGHGSDLPIIVFARGSEGGKIPMRVSVAPIRDADGEVVGGVETFRDVSEEYKDAQRAGRIQSALLDRPFPSDSRVSFATHYVPRGIIGGDHYALARVDEDRIAFLLADVMGHGLAAALDTVQLDALWQNHPELWGEPGKLAQMIGSRLSALFGDDVRFAASILGLLDLKQMQVVLAFAGGPPPILFSAGADPQPIDGSGLPLGCMTDAEYVEQTVPIRSGDCLLAFTDGAVEVSDSGEDLLGSEGLGRVLADVGYPESASLKAVEEKLLKSSEEIRFKDDVTFLEIRLA